MLKDLKGKLIHVLPLDGKSYAEMEVHNGYKPNIELEYKWMASPKKDKQWKPSATGDGAQLCQDIYNQLKERLIALLNEQIKNDKIQDSEFSQYLEYKISTIIDRISKEKQSVLEGLDNANRTLIETEGLHDEYEQRDLQDAESVDLNTDRTQGLINLIDASIDEAMKKNVEIRKNTGAIATLSAADKQQRIEDEERRHK